MSIAARASIDLTTADRYSAIAGPAIAPDRTNLLIAAATDAISRYCNRIFYKEKIIKEKHFGHGRLKLYVDRPPIVTVEAIRINGAAVAAADYEAFLEEGYIFKATGWTWNPGYYQDITQDPDSNSANWNIEIDYTGGYVLQGTEPERVSQSFIINSAITPETQTGLGSILSVADVVWDTVHDSDGTGGTVSPNFVNASAYKDVGGTNEYRISRGFLPFGTSALPDDLAARNPLGTVTLLYPYGSGFSADDPLAHLVLLESTQASMTGLVAADFNNCGLVDSPIELSDKVSIEANVDSVLHNPVLFTLNAAGIAVIDPAGYTSFGLRVGYDAGDVAVPYPKIGAEFCGTGGSGAVGPLAKLEVTCDEIVLPTEPSDLEYACILLVQFLDALSPGMKSESVGNYKYEVHGTVANVGMPPEVVGIINKYRRVAVT